MKHIISIIEYNLTTFTLIKNHTKIVSCLDIKKELDSVYTSEYANYNENNEIVSCHYNAIDKSFILCLTNNRVVLCTVTAI